jgi:hypothetical protein
MLNQFEIASGSVAGRDHQGAGKNNHDAAHWVASEQTVIGVVCDGCGSGKHSEVGSKIGAQLVVEALSRQLTRAGAVGFHQEFVSEIFERVRQDVLAHIRLLANSMGTSLSQTITDYFLFTLVGFLITKEFSLVFSIGDGLYAINGDVVHLGPFLANTPPYLTYALVGSSLEESNPDALRFQFTRCFSTEAVKSILVGTDGVGDLERIALERIPGKSERVGPLSQFWEEDRYFTNSDAIRRRLVQINTDSKKPDWAQQRMIKEAGLLADDTTLVVVRKKPLA